MSHLLTSSALALVAGHYVLSYLRKSNMAAFEMVAQPLGSIVGVKRVTIVYAYACVDVRTGESTELFEYPLDAYASLLYAGRLRPDW